MKEKNSNSSSPKFSRAQVEHLKRVFGDYLQVKPEMSANHVMHKAGMDEVIRYCEDNIGYEPLRDLRG